MNWVALDAVAELAASKGCSPAQLAIAWLLTRDEVSTVIAGASNPEQARDNALAADITIDGSELEALERSLPAVPGGAVGALELRDHLRGA